MKIFKTAGLLLFSSLFIFSCKTTSVQVTDAAAAEGAAAQTAQEEENSEKTLEYPVKKENEVWTDNSGKSEPFSKGLVTLRYKKKLGSFNIAVKNKAEKLIPVLSTVEEYTTSAFYLKSNNKIIKLFNDSNIKTGYSKSENAVRITYSVPDLADVVLEFLIFPSVEGGIEDMVKVTATVINKTSVQKELGLKTILDTVLGEVDSYHFYTRNGVPVTSEVLYKTMANEKWIVSRNPSAAMQMFFYGADCTAPEALALGNYGTFDKKEWVPNMYNYRGFDSAYSYNNSAVAVVWPTFRLNPNESGKCIFYLAFATDYDNPQGEKYLFPESDEEEVEPLIPAEPAQEKVFTRTIESARQTEPQPERTAPAMDKIQKKTPSAPQKKKKADPKQFSNQQLTPEYVQNLLDRIIALEEDDASLNRAEIFQLNAELDAILEVLGL